MWDKIAAFFAGNVVREVGGVIDTLSTSDEEKASAKAAISAIVTNSLNELAKTQAEVINTEAGGSFLQRNWRPMVMLAFATILMAKWFGFTDRSISDTLELELMSLLEIGIGGYVAGRTLEKVADTVTKNIDLNQLRRKDRSQSIN